ncbi:MAG: LapA family protein [Deltaproteobacteria bacterium]|nr:MAG: LapA family protein [Deltaproteobacteria bacterium]
MKEKGSNDLKEFVKKPKTIVAFVIIALLLIIFFQNTQVVTFRIFFWKISMSQIILIPLTMIIGLVLGYVIAKATGNRHQGRMLD